MEGVWGTCYNGFREKVWGMWGDLRELGRHLGGRPRQMQFYIKEIRFCTKAILHWKSVCYETLV